MQREQPVKELTFGQKAAYGIGAVGKDVVYGLSATFVMYYYQDVMGISAAFVGIILMIARVFDAVNDPLMGVVVGKTKTRWGRFRPWLFTGSVINAFVLYALFSCPSLEGTSLMVYFSVTYILWGLTYTMMDIPYWSMIPAVTHTPKARENLSVIGRTCAGVGAALVSAFTMLLVGLLGGGNEQEGFKWFALIVAIFFVIAEVLCCIGFKESSKSPAEMKTTSVRKMFSSLFRNDQAMVMVVCITLFYIGMYLASNLFIYFFKYDFGGDDWRATYTLFTTLGGIMQLVGMMVIYPLLRKKLSNTSIFVLSLVVLVCSYGALLATCLFGFSTFLPALLAYDCFIYACNGIMSVLITLFLASTVDYGQMKTGNREESMIFSMQTFVVKAGSGFAVFMAGVGLDLIGLQGGTEETGAVIAQTASTLTGLEITMTVPSMIVLACTIVIFKKMWKLTDARSAQIMEELKAKGLVGVGPESDSGDAPASEAAAADQIAPHDANASKADDEVAQLQDGPEGHDG